MRGGTSRGPYFLWQHLPRDRADVDKVLLRAMGTPEDPELANKKNTQVNGVGGATSVTSKVAILGASSEPGIDVDYTFAQVAVGKSYVDWEPSCGNMLAGVGPAAIEMGLIKNISSPVTPVKIRAINNGALVEAIIQTPDKQVIYEGDASIDGVPGTGAPVTLNFMNVVGSKTGKLLPTGKEIDVINGVEVTCIDVAMPIVIATAESLGKTGYESKAELDEDEKFFERIEAIRRIAGEKMGLGDVSNRVVPKFAIVAPPSDKDKGNITARYFVPDSTHGAMAVTGAICIGSCSILRGSVADKVSVKTSIGGTKNRVVIEHPSGNIQIILDSEQDDSNPGMKVNSAGVLRTCRLLFEGFMTVPRRKLTEDDVRQESSHYIRYYEQLQKDFRRLYNFKAPEEGNEKIKIAAKGTEKEEQLPTWDDEDPEVQPKVNATSMSA